MAELAAWEAMGEAEAGAGAAAEPHNAKGCAAMEEPLLDDEFSRGRTWTPLPERPPPAPLSRPTLRRDVKSAPCLLARAAARRSCPSGACV